MYTFTQKELKLTLAFFSGESFFDKTFDVKHLPPAITNLELELELELELVLV